MVLWGTSPGCPFLRMKLKNQNILIGITGGIAAYKICDLISLLRKEGANIRVVMTDSARKFITSLTIRTLSRNTVYKDNSKVNPTSLTKWARVVLIAPATANTISKIAFGRSDNLLTLIVKKALKKKTIFIAPAMNTNMWNNQIVRQNIKKLKLYKKVIFIEPKVGRLACGDIGKGPLADLKDILKAIKKV